LTAGLGKLLRPEAGRELKTKKPLTACEAHPSYRVSASGRAMTGCWPLGLFLGATTSAAT
jgi:hypothetical protein